MVGIVEVAIGLLVFAIIATTPTRYFTGIWECLVRWAADRSPAGRNLRPVPSISGANSTERIVLHRVRVIDGDTMQDMGTGVRYRVENIDAPETGDRAKCFRERMQGEIATRVARRLFREARTTTAAPIGRTDKYGRVVARIELDGADFGATMIDRGFARPWSGERERWCGGDGGLALLAQKRSHRWSCKKCAAWRHGAGPKKRIDNVVELRDR